MSKLLLDKNYAVIEEEMFRNLKMAILLFLPVANLKEYFFPRLKCISKTKNNRSAMYDNILVSY